MGKLKIDGVYNDDNFVIRLGDDAGVNKLSIQNNSNVEVAYIDSLGNIVAEIPATPISPVVLDFAVVTKTVGQGSWTITVDPNSLHNFNYANGAGANADNFSVPFYCAAGTYILRCMLTKYTTRGIIDVDIDAVEVASFDCYGVLNYTTIFEQTGIVIAAGAHTMRFRVDGKNASSSGYVFGGQGAILEKTA